MIWRGRPAKQLRLHPELPEDGARLRRRAGPAPLARCSGQAAGPLSRLKRPYKKNESGARAQDAVLVELLWGEGEALSPDAAVPSQRCPPDVSAASLVFRPESLFDGPGARRRPPEAENVQKKRPLQFFAAPGSEGPCSVC